MKRIFGAVVAVVLASGAAVVAPTTASAAILSSVVTSSEFFDVTQGNSIGYVRQVFGNDGRVVYREDPPGTADDYLWVRFPTYYDDGFVEVEFARRASGTWYLVNKTASWDNWPLRTADKATESEFHRVGAGNTLGHVREVFGTPGTVTYYLDLAGEAGDRVSVAWPTDAVHGRVQVDFVTNASGVWRATERRGFWDVSPHQDARQVTDTDFYDVEAGNTLDFARRTFGSAGAINSYDDRGGSEYDSLHVKWPVWSPDGWVALRFVRDRAGAWRVADRDATWLRQAVPTTDTATRAELAVLQEEVSRGGGVTLVRARDVFGTPGTVQVHDIVQDGPGMLLVSWYTGAVDRDVTVEFRKSPAGVWTATTTDALRGPWD